MVYPAERANRAIDVWMNTDRSDTELRLAIAQQVGQAIYWERRTILSHVEGLLARALAHSSDEDLKGDTCVGPFKSALSFMITILARQHRSDDEGTPGFEDFNPNRNRVNLRRLLRFDKNIRRIPPELVRDLERASNSYPSECTRCGHWIDSHEGVLERCGENWSVRHHHGLCHPGPAPFGQIQGQPTHGRVSANGCEPPETRAERATPPVPQLPTDRAAARSRAAPGRRSRPSR
jgi:hypothetical protein